MKDFPVFTTENGVASLILREIPYSQSAYIKLLDSLDPAALLEECRQFCAMVGAEHIYAAGDPVLKEYPVHTRINEMVCHWTEVPQTKATTIPVTEQNLSQWKEIYNQKMRSVPNSAYMDNNTANEMLTDGSGCFVELDGQIIGIGKGVGNQVEAIASTAPGKGKDVLLALCKQLGGSCFRLQVADTNTRAVSLYERLGFVKTKEISCWYKIL